ncbi:MAG: hypothetical protein FJZ43_00145 [Candidatus Staskawiczbacteria bacterium]|nr:hypothetical protein [Candidatus Staskawiczbacteria bacterium]
MKYRLLYQIWSYDVVTGMRYREEQLEAPDDEMAKTLLSQFSFNLKERVHRLQIKAFFIRELFQAGEHPDEDRLVIRLDTASTWTP